MLNGSVLFTLTTKKGSVKLKLQISRESPNYCSLFVISRACQRSFNVQLLRDKIGFFEASSTLL